MPNSFAKNFHSILTNEQRQAQTPQKAKRHFALLLFFCCPFLLLFTLAKGIIFLCHKQSRRAKQAKFLQKANGTFVAGKTLCFSATSKKQAQTETVVFLQRLGFGVVEFFLQQPLRFCATSEVSKQQVGVRFRFNCGRIVAQNICKGYTQ